MHFFSFTLIKNYKALKQELAYELKRSWFYTYKKLQGSQTSVSIRIKTFMFYTYKKLQGSQTKASKKL